MLTESARILARRWLWVAASLIISLALGAAGYVAGPQSEVSNATVLFVPPSTQPGVVGRTNPFYSLGGSTLVMTTVVEVLVADDKTSTRLGREGYRAKYEVTPNLALNSGPSLLVKVDDRSAAMTQATMNAVLREIRDQLKSVQTAQGVTSNLLIQSVVLTQSPHPTADHKDQIQVGAIAMIGALFILVILILLIERRQVARQTIRPETQIETESDRPRMDPPDPPDRPEPLGGTSSLAGPRRPSAHRQTGTSLPVRRRMSGADRPSRFGRSSP